jgi:protein-disulfide isomerase
MAMNRRRLFHLGGFCLALLIGGRAGAQDVRAILDDPDAPVEGDPHGDVTIVAFVDYNCPSCRKSAPALDSLTRKDGRVRVVYKDWPILSQASVSGAKLALAARYQGQYRAAHLALMKASGARTDQDMAAARAAAGVDVARLKTDLDAHDAEIAALLQRNRQQADSLGLAGTPVYLIGPYKIAQPLDEAGFAKVVAQVRALARQ